MICVTLGRARHKRMIAEHKFLTEQGAFILEASHYNDAATGDAFLRFSFNSRNGLLPSVAELETAFRPHLFL